MSSSDGIIETIWILFMQLFRLDVLKTCCHHPFTQQCQITYFLNLILQRFVSYDIQPQPPPPPTRLRHRYPNTIYCVFARYELDQIIMFPMFYNKYTLKLRLSVEIATNKHPV